jgi:hypothetical protein
MNGNANLTNLTPDRFRKSIATLITVSDSPGIGGAQNLGFTDGLSGGRFGGLNEVAHGYNNSTALCFSSQEYSANRFSTTC